MTQSDRTNPAAALDAFLARPTDDDPADRRIASMMSGHLVAQSPPLILGTIAKIVIHDHGDNEEPYLATLEVHAGGSWQVRSIDFRCATCFGELIHFDDGSPCSTCGATGWGLADVREAASEPSLDRLRSRLSECSRVSPAIVVGELSKFCIYHHSDTHFDRPILVTVDDNTPWTQVAARCPKCAGSGIDDSLPCFVCQTTGWELPRERHDKVSPLALAELISPSLRADLEGIRS